MTTAQTTCSDATADTPSVAAGERLAIVSDIGTEDASASIGNVSFTCD